MAEWYEIENANEIDSPALLFYADRVKENIQKAIREAGDVSRLRPHVKTHKSPEVTRLMLEAGISKFKCSTIAEAEMLAMSGAKDILMAYQLNKQKAGRFLALIRKYGPLFSCLFDNENTLELYSQIATENEIKIPVYLDINVGMNRTGIEPGEAAVQLYEKAVATKGIEAKGLHVYDGQIHTTDIEKRTEECNKAFEPVAKMIEPLHTKGYDQIQIVAGGSPSFPIHARRKGVGLSPGTFIYWDWGYKKILPEQPFDFGALVLTRIISLPEPDLICVDLGHKSIASENELSKRVHFLNAPELTPVSQNEEHLVLRTKGGHRYRVGDVLYGVPYHVCPTCALYERGTVVENGKAIGEWRVLARDRKLSI